MDSSVTGVNNSLFVFGGKGYGVSSVLSILNLSIILL